MTPLHMSVTELPSRLEPWSDTHRHALMDQLDEICELIDRNGQDFLAGTLMWYGERDELTGAHYSVVTWSEDA